MFCNYLVDIYKNHIQPNLLGDELIYNYIVKQEFIRLIDEYSLTELYSQYEDITDLKSSEVLYCNKEYKIGFTTTGSSLWIVEENIFGFLKSHVNNYDYLLNTFIFNETFVKVLNTQNFPYSQMFSIESPFYKKAIKYLKNKYAL